MSIVSFYDSQHQNTLKKNGRSKSRAYSSRRHLEADRQTDGSSCYVKAEECLYSTMLISLKYDANRKTKSINYSTSDRLRNIDCSLIRLNCNEPSKKNKKIELSEGILELFSSPQRIYIAIIALKTAEHMIMLVKHRFRCLFKMQIVLEFVCISNIPWANQLESTYRTFCHFCEFSLQDSKRSM